MITATQKLAQVQGRTSAVNSRTLRSLRLRPSRRRSTIVMEPTTNAMAITCTLSMLGKSQEDSLIATAGAVDSSHNSKRANIA